MLIKSIIKAGSRRLIVVILQLGEREGKVMYVVKD